MYKTDSYLNICIWFKSFDDHLYLVLRHWCHLFTITFLEPCHCFGLLWICVFVASFGSYYIFFLPSFSFKASQFWLQTNYSESLFHGMALFTCQKTCYMFYLTGEGNATIDWMEFNSISILRIFTWIITKHVNRMRFKNAVHVHCTYIRGGTEPEYIANSSCSIRFGSCSRTYEHPNKFVSGHESNKHNSYDHDPAGDANVWRKVFR